ncbi:hypothetical protein JCM5296_006319 [Sporobolomyces johnsonii]
MAAHGQQQQQRGSFDASWEDALTASASFDSFDGSLLDIFGGEPMRGLSANHNHTYNSHQDVFSGQQTATPRGMVSGAISSDGSVVAYSDTSSPQGGAGNLAYTSPYYAASTGAASRSGALDFELESILAHRSGSGSGSATSGAPSPPFSFATADPAAFACDFDTTSLQSLFAHPSSTQQGVHQTVSPPSATSPSATMLHAAGSSSDFSFLNPAQAPSYPQAYPQQPAFLAQPQPQRYADVRRASLSSTHALSASPQHLHTNMQPLALPDDSDPKRRRISLAETAGLPRPQPIAPSNNAAAPSMAFALKPDVFSQLASTGMTGRAGTAPMQQRQGQGLQRQRSPVELIANAGMLNGVYRAPAYQQVSPPPQQLQNAPVVAGKGTRKTSVSTASQAPAADEKAGGGKRKKGAERGHNAVEQKYRNSINNALATLRDTIPALRHLKPLPSMPATKRKASQFTLPSGVSTATPTGLVDGVTAAKTLSKGVILNKAIEYIDFLRFAREAHNEDLELFKDMVRSMVGDGERLVEEFERRREAKEKERIEQREREREEGEDDEENGDEEDDQEEEEKPAPVAANGRKAAASAAAGGASARKRTKKDQPAAAPAKSMAAAAAATSPISLPSQQISPPLTADYRHVQALNAAHLESLAGGQQYFPQQRTGSNPFPPSPVSSDELSVSPSAIMGDGTYRPHAPHPAYSAQPPRVLLASFMGLSFAGGLGYDWTSSAGAAAEGASEVVGKAWTSRLLRRAAEGVDADHGGRGRALLVDLLHPSLLSGLVALGVASIVVSVVYLVYPLFSSAAAASSATTASSGDRRRDRALSSLAAASAGASESQTYATSRSAALQARKELLALAGAPPALLVLPALLKEMLVWALGVGLGLSWAGGAGKADQEMVEKALAWVRVAEIEATVGDDISRISRIYTFLRLSNLSRSTSWPEITPSTARPAVTALLAMHLLSLDHPRWAESLWTRMLSQRKKLDSDSSSASSSNAADSFIDLALSADFERVRLLLSPSSRPSKAETDAASPSDTVPLLLIAESTCLEALLDVWTQLFIAVVGTTCPPHLTGAESMAPSQKTLETLVDRAEIDETLEIVANASDVEGSEVRTLALLTTAFVGCFFAPSPSSDELARSTKARIAHLLVEAKRRGPFARLAAAAPFCQLLLPASAALAIDLLALPKLFSTPPTNEVDLVATTTLAWLLVRRQGLPLLSHRSSSPDPEPHEQGGGDSKRATDPALHAQALEVRRLLAHESFRDNDNDALREVDHYKDEDEDEDDGSGRARGRGRGRARGGKLDFDEAKDLLVDALTVLARRAAGLGASLDDDSGVEL